jgi:hypothetical protein
VGEFGEMWEISKKLFVIILSVALASNGFASSSDGFDLNRPLSENEGSRVDALNLARPDISTFSTEVVHEGKALTVDIARGQVGSHELTKIVQVFRMMEPQIRKAYELDPNLKIKFYHITDSSNHTYVPATEILDFLESISKGVLHENIRIDQTTADKLKAALGSIFDQTSRSDLYWGMARLAGGGSSSIFSFYFSNLPLPAALFVGVAVSGAGSAAIGIFIEKFTGWLDHNVVDPTKNIRNRLGSIETYMLLSPALIALTSQHVNNIESALLIAGTATASVIVQNVYHTIRKVSPNAAMWYKWYATEVLFVSAPSIALNLLGYGAANLTATVTTAFYAGLLTTVSQGVWDILITKMRKPFLEAAIQRDLSEFAERFNGKSVLSIRADQMKNITSMDQLIAVTSGKDVTKMTESEYRAIAHKYENEVRERFKKFYYFASAWSVASAMAMTAGANAGNAALTNGGTLGLVVLGISGFSTWLFVKIKNRYSATTKPVAVSKRMETPANACKRDLF